MPISRGVRRGSAGAAVYPHPVAFSIQVARNILVQGLGIAMVSLTGLSVLAWPAVLIWTLAAVAVAAGEHRFLRLISEDRAFARRAGAWAPALRVVATTTYAVAAFALIVNGGPGQRLFAFALMSMSLVNVLMRYYRSPRILAASIAPHAIVLALVSVGLTRTALREGHILGAVISSFTIGLFAVQIWSARAQLAGAWGELVDARQAAEDREHAAEAANRAKSAFLATMSHELRTPLNGVLGMVQALKADGLTDVQHERVSVIRRSSETLLATLDDLLDLSKIEAGALTVETVEFDLEHLLRGLATVYRPQAERKGLSFDYEVAADAAGRYRGDSLRIRRALYSLADNAVKFTHSGGVRLCVERANDSLVFCLTDTGVGVAPADLPHLFEGFFQADSSRTRKYDGAGLGLAICAGLTDLMGGTLRASSTPGQGSAFTLTLPLERAVVVPAAAPQAEPEHQTELRVLAAEDNETNQFVLKTLLAPIGLFPTLVANGREAVDAWESGAWDIVLMDIQMPEMDGVAATRAIRQRELETGRPRTPIVAVTANAMTHQVVEYRAAGMDGVAAKPLDLAKLIQVIESALTPPGPQTVAA